MSEHRHRNPCDCEVIWVEKISGSFQFNLLFREGWAMGLNGVSQGLIQMSNICAGNTTRFLLAGFAVILEESQGITSQFGNNVSAARVWIQRGPNLGFTETEEIEEHKRQLLGHKTTSNPVTEIWTLREDRRHLNLRVETAP